MNTVIKEDKAPELQKVATFSGDGAYHGANKIKDRQAPETELDETNPTSLANKDPFEIFMAWFRNTCDVKSILDLPSQEEIQNDGITFMWAPFDVALAEAGPLTKRVLLAMEPYLERKKKFIYIDSKIQYFKAGDIPVDSKLWHVDGAISVRDKRALDLGFPLLHDMKARLITKAPPKYLAYQSSTHCATQFATKPISIFLSSCITSFDSLDEKISSLDPERLGIISQPASSIISFDGYSLHRAVPAEGDGWRLWIRCTETDREIYVDSAAVSCYGTVFRQ